MMGVFNGMILMQWSGADIPAALENIRRAEIPLYSIRFVDEVTVRFTINRGDRKRLENLAHSRGDRINTVAEMGMNRYLRKALNRPILLAGTLLLLTMGFILPGRILFVSVEGNQSIPDRMILEAAEDCGLKFGTSRRGIRSEQIKNALLEAVPQLRWAGVNTYGCRAVITVRERSSSEPEEKKSSVCHVTASRDGIISSCTVTQGTGVCTLGQAVRQGDLLISGYTDCGISMIAQRAEGEVFARTQRNLTVVTPSEMQIQVPAGTKRTKFSLIIGKKRINFFKGSGISGASCDKMYSEYVLTLPGGFSLPVMLVKETVIECTLADAAVQDGNQLLEEFSAAYLKTQMISGSVLKRSESLKEAEGILYLSGTYACVESIGRIQEEMIGEFNGKADGTDRQRGSGG